MIPDLFFHHGGRILICFDDDKKIPHLHDKKRTALLVVNKENYELLIKELIKSMNPLSLKI